MRAHLVFRAGAVVVALAACTDDSPDAAGETSSTPVPVVETGPVAATELVIGDCLGGVAVGARERTRIQSARVVSCEQSHQLEVFGSFALDPAQFATQTPGAYPGQEPVVDAADVGCKAALEELADVTAFGLITLWPSEESWAQGDRTVLCAAFPADGTPFEARQLLAEA